LVRGGLLSEATAHGGDKAGTIIQRQHRSLEQDLDGTPKKIIEQLDRLRLAEEQRMKSEPR